MIFGDGHVGTPRQNRFDPGQGLELMTPEVLHALVFEVVPYCCSKIHVILSVARMALMGKRFAASNHNSFSFYPFLSRHSEKNRKEWPRPRWFHHNFPEVVSLCPFLRPFCWFFPFLSGLDGRSPAWTMGKRPPWALCPMVKRASHTMFANQGVSAASPVQDFGTFFRIVITSSGVIPKCDNVNKRRRFYEVCCLKCLHEV